MKTPSFLCAAPVQIVLLLLAGFGVGHFTLLPQTNAQVRAQTQAPIQAQTQASPTLHGDKAHPAQTRGWVDTKLYFGLGPAEDSSKGVSEEAWRDFLDKEVTPRFPDGLSVVDVYGQWLSKEQGKNGTAPEHIRSKMLIVDYQDTPRNQARIEAIRSAWKRRTGDQSVMKVTQPADVSF